MKNINKVLLSAVMTIGLVSTASAHDPKMHMKKAKKADCSMMEKMDKTKMDKKKMKSSDPVMMAMMKKCAKQAKEGMEHKHNEGSEKHEHKHDEGNEEHQHH